MKRFRWLIVWLAQIAAMLAVGCLLSLSLWLGRGLYNACLWGLLPLAGFAAACLATRKGLLNYAAWIAPPVCGALGHLLVWFYAPDAGPILLTAFVSIVGAATGEVLKQNGRRS